LKHSPHWGSPHLLRTTDFSYARLRAILLRPDGFCCAPSMAGLEPTVSPLAPAGLQLATIPAAIQTAPAADLRLQPTAKGRYIE